MPGRPDVDVGSAESLIKKVRDLKPSQFVTDRNFAFSVLDDKALTNGRFIRSLYNPVDLLRVRDAAGNVTRRLRDGHNRMYGAYLVETGQVEFTNEIERAESNIEGLEGRDITDLIIASKYSDQPGKKELTVAEYLDEVVDFAKNDMKEMRMAAHMISEWETQVGSEIADRFTALAAIGMLGFSPLGDLRPTKLEERLRSSNTTFVVGETLEARETIIEGLVQFAGVSRDKSLPYADVAHAAFDLAAKELSDEALQKQVGGLLALPAIEEKITTGVSDEQERDQRKDQLQMMIVDALREESRTTSEESRALYEVLVDSAFNYNDVITVLSPSEWSILARYRNAKASKTSASILRRTGPSFDRPTTRRKLGDTPQIAAGEKNDQHPLISASFYLQFPPDRFGPTDVALIRRIHEQTGEILAAVDAAASPSVVQEDTTTVDTYWSERRKTNYNPQKHCTRGWFEDLSVKPLSDENRDRVTLAIEDTIKHILPRSYRTVLSFIEDADGSHGLDVLANSLSPRLARLAHEVLWGKELPEFQYLVAMHMVRMLKVRAGKGPISEVMPYIALLTQKIQEEIVPQFHIKGSDGYPQLLEFALYADDSPALHTVQLALKSRSFYDAYSARSLAEKFVGSGWRWNTTDREASRSTVLAALDRYFNQTIGDLDN